MSKIKKITAYGADFSLTHGCLLKATFMFDRDDLAHPSFVSHEIVFEWHSGELGLKTPEHEFLQFALKIIEAMRKHQTSVIGIDWDAAVGQWGGGKAFAPVVGFFLGGFSMAAGATGFKPIFLKPADIRKLLGVAQRNAPKEAVWQQAKRWMSGDMDGVISSFADQNKKIKEDGVDSFLLAAVAAHHLAVLTFAQEETLSPQKRIL